MVAWVGRMSLAPDEVLELLLTGFGISRQATGTVQRVAAFQRCVSALPPAHRSPSRLKMRSALASMRWSNWSH
jgi:hypothetical protein